MPAGEQCGRLRYIRFVPAHLNGRHPPMQTKPQKRFGVRKCVSLVLLVLTVAVFRPEPMAAASPRQVAPVDLVLLSPANLPVDLRVHYRLGDLLSRQKVPKARSVLTVYG